MNKASVSGDKLSISILTGRREDALLVQKTLAHVYLGVSVWPCQNETELLEKTRSVRLIDTSCIPKAALEHVLDKTPEALTVLVVNDFSEIKLYNHLLTSRHSMIARADLCGMGLIQCIHHLLERKRLHEQLQKTSMHLKELSIRDELTHLFNHRHFDDLLTVEVKKANRYKRPLALVIVALKNFTAINESFGHTSGDRILQKTATIIREVIRDVDVPARYGDNEFAVILPESDEEAASIVAERLKEALGAISIPTADGSFTVLTSLGIAALSAGIPTKEDLLRTALGALIEAKRNGSSTICTSGEITARHATVHENLKLIEQTRARIARLSSEAEHNYFQTIFKAIGEIPEAKKLFIQHSERVAFFAQRLAESCNMGEVFVRAIHHAGLLHDAGKIAIAPEILAKDKRLLAAEYDLIKQHPVIALKILEAAPLLRIDLDAVLNHHERIDGTGYPGGIKGDAIPLSARILGIAEAWDTMITPQPYRPEPLTLDAALGELQKNAGTQFDANLVDRFVGLITG